MPRYFTVTRRKKVGGAPTGVTVALAFPSAARTSETDSPSNVNTGSSAELESRIGRLLEWRGSNVANPKFSLVPLMASSRIHPSGLLISYSAREGLSIACLAHLFGL